MTQTSQCVASRFIVDLRLNAVLFIPMASIFDQPRWLDYKHDGYALTVDLDNYFPLRGTLLKGSQSTHDTLAANQSCLTLGLLESVTLNPMTEADLLSTVKVTGEDVQTLCSEKIHVILKHFDTLPD